MMLRPKKGKLRGRGGGGKRGGGKGAAGASPPAKLASGSSVSSPAGKNSSMAMSSSSLAGGCAGGSVTGIVLAINDNGIDEELAKLLVSTHGKPFPSISSIFAGASIKRELGGVLGSELF